MMTIILCLAGIASLRADGIKVVCTTFPIYQITRQVTAGQPGVTLDLLLPAGLGCPHDYALTPQDMRKLAGADVLVVNGLGQEEFLGAPLRQANPGVTIVDSSSGIETLADCRHDAEDCEHAAHRANPHLFASPRQAGRLALNIAEGLAQADRDRAGACRRQADAWAAVMTALADDFSAVVRELPNNRIIQPHGVFDYLARDAGLEVVGTLQPHGHEPGASEMLRLVGLARTRGVGAVFVEPQYSDKVARTVARELGVPLAMIDPVASGPADAPLDYYEAVMRRNLETIRGIFGDGR
ncbi:MAG: metal ABC transporter substrate-binding protein [Kiritimatiellia bacterium]